jgi:hypothetical protein
MAQSSLADSSAGALVMWTRVACLAGGGIWAAVVAQKSELPVTPSASIKSNLFMRAPQNELFTRLPTNISKERMEAAGGPHASIFSSYSSLSFAV